jgi:hypothetical protein
MVIGDDLAAFVLPNGNARACGAEVNANCRSGSWPDRKSPHAKTEQPKKKTKKVLHFTAHI